MAETACRNDAEYLFALRGELLDLPVQDIPVDTLRVTDSPRSRVEDPGHSRVLAQAQDALPPVIVHRPTMTVVDGVHRLRAAQLRGRTTIPVRFFDGSAEDARLLAVALNVTHGLPLTLAERTAAAERILTARPDWSDRAVASLAGLSVGKTAEIRRRVLDPAVPGTKRIGRDGRARPLDASHGRALAAALLTQDPTASLRRVAREAGISPATVADVRARLARGDDPVGPRHIARRTPAPAAPKPAPDVGEMHRRLRRDPALRFSETGRSFLRLLEAGAALDRHREGIAAGLPPHCRAAAAHLAQAYAQSWELFANELQ
ncbi:ParB/RepB/Spo0J family partition protein [Streptomyces sp. NPDC058755]|uniref:ParB/RepB/Spo0J family partition protein n=1 Tax=Streptomyces sp. NPDC058755 TaxID=3346624 RepID=UPI00369FAD65